MNTKRIIAGHLVVLALAFPPTVSAEDFTFNVPVNFSNIHEDVDMLRILCLVKGDDNSVNIGVGAMAVDTSNNGNFNQTITVKFDAFTAKNPADAKFYECVLQLVRRGAISGLRASDNGTCTNPENDYLCAKEGATYHPRSTGPIP